MGGDCGMGKDAGRMIIADLGEIAGDIVLSGGIVSNLHALDALADETRGRAVIATGDIVAYCARPAECVARIRDLGWPTIAGNVERQLAEDADDCGCGFGDGTACDILSARWYEYARRAVVGDDRAWMDALPDRIVFRAHGRRWAVIHGGATAINAFIWPTSEDRVLRAEIELLRDQVGGIDGVVAGHSGIPFVREVDGVQWVNAGSVGMPPHDGKAHTRYAVLGTDGARIECLEYDVAGAVLDMEAAELTQGYHDALRTGWWPSEDILPRELRRASGARQGMMVQHE